MIPLNMAVWGLAVSYIFSICSVGDLRGEGGGGIVYVLKIHPLAFLISFVLFCFCVILIAPSCCMWHVLRGVGRGDSGGPLYSAAGELCTIFSQFFSNIPTFDPPSWLSHTHRSGDWKQWLTQNNSHFVMIKSNLWLSLESTYLKQYLLPVWVVVDGRNQTTQLD